MSFRTTAGSASYVLTVDGSQADAVEVSARSSTDYVAIVTGAPMTVVRNATESFYCSEGVNFRLVLGR